MAQQPVKFGVEKGGDGKWYTTAYCKFLDDSPRRLNGRFNRRHVHLTERDAKFEAKTLQKDYDRTAD